ncbi:MAG: HD domain-containing protein [Pseudomonadota bacterium]|nr:HD domain-containing protein [Pseudomonadota bacterium]|tara:strand:- start:179 stop:1063 length:885 start_codon:yes stop_codon:yes gene_type:complete
MNSISSKSLLLVSESTVELLLKYYDYPHPEKIGEIIEGYDKNHVLRTSKMCAALAIHLGYDEKLVREYQIACLLHDLGRAGLDQKLFGKIWSWAKTHKIPTRPLEWRKKYPKTKYGYETEAFWDMHSSQLCKIGIKNLNWAKEQVEMRLGYARRLSRLIKKIKPKLKTQNIEWADWMEKVTLYYYYPEKMDNAPGWMREFGEILVACEQLEAYSNRTRGKDYYNRGNESFLEAFDYLENLKNEGRISGKVLSALHDLIAKGFFDDILREARNGYISEEELRFLRTINTEDSKCQ